MDKINDSLIIKIQKKCNILALKALKKGEIPVGSIIYDPINNKIISQAYNQRETTLDIFSHAEIIAIKKASKKLKSWKLNNMILFTTLQPCIVCLGAITESNIDKIIYGAKNNIYTDDIFFNILKQIFKKRYSTYAKYVKNTEYNKILNNFFKNIRNKKTYLNYNE